MPQESAIFQNISIYLFKGFSYYAFLQADQLVEFMCEVEDGWWKGRVGGRVGVFPSNFVEMCSDERDKFQNSVEARNKKNSAGAQRSKECEIDSTKELGQKILNSSQNLTPPKPSDEGGNQMTTSERSIMGNKTPPDTAPRLPPKPGILFSLSYLLHVFCTAINFIFTNNFSFSLNFLLHTCIFKKIADKKWELLKTEENQNVSWLHVFVLVSCIV